MLLEAPSTRDRSEALDLIRCICALWVLLAHVIPWAGIVAGKPISAALLSGALVRIFQPAGETHPAVLIFIVLSGYCIHRGGFRGADRPDLRSYGLRRAFRILPVYVLAIAVGAVAWSISSGVSHELTQRLSGTSSLTLSTILLRLSGISAFIPQLNPITYAGNAPLHTVMVEIWLYVVYPIVLLLMLRYGESRVYVGLACIWLTGALICSGNGALTNWWHNGSVFGFLPYWWIGASCISAKLDRRLALTAGALWLVLTVIAPRHLLLVEAHKACLAVLAGMAIAALDRKRTYVPEILSWSGKAGYSLYAFHAPVAYALLIMGWHWLAVVAAAIAVGAGVFVAYENPLNRVGRKLAAATPTRPLSTIGAIPLGKKSQA